MDTKEDLLLEHILNRTIHIEDKVDQLTSKMHQVDLKYERLRIKAVGWSSLGAAGTVGLTQSDIFKTILGWLS